MQPPPLSRARPIAGPVLIRAQFFGVAPVSFLGGRGGGDVCRWWVRVRVRRFTVHVYSLSPSLSPSLNPSLNPSLTDSENMVIRFSGVTVDRRRAAGQHDLECVCVCVCVCEEGGGDIEMLTVRRTRTCPLTPILNTCIHPYYHPRSHSLFLCSQL